MNRCQSFEFLAVLYPSLLSRTIEYFYILYTHVRVIDFAGKILYHIDGILGGIGVVLFYFVFVFFSFTIPAGFVRVF